MPHLHGFRGYSRPVGPTRYIKMQSTPTGPCAPGRGYSLRHSLRTERKRPLCCRGWIYEELTGYSSAGRACTMALHPSLSAPDFLVAAWPQGRGYRIGWLLVRQKGVDVAHRVGNHLILLRSRNSFPALCPSPGHLRHRLGSRPLPASRERGRLISPKTTSPKKNS